MTTIPIERRRGPYSEYAVAQECAMALKRNAAVHRIQIIKVGRKWWIAYLALDPSGASENPRRYSLKTFRTTFVTEAGAPDPQVHNSAECINILRDIFARLDANQEHFIVLSLNTKNRIYGYKVVHSGGLAISVVDPRLVFGAALKLEAANIIVSHNHPSGTPDPSEEDRLVTKRLTRAGEALGIKMLDHIIVGEETHYSFAGTGNL